jgi:class 3 adenylate cyclase
MQPILSCTFDGSGHALRALRAANAVRDEVARAQFPTPAGHQFQVCTGINTGEIVDADIGGGARMTFQSVGTIQTLAARLQEFAGPGQIFLSSETYRETIEAVRVLSIGEVRVNAAGEKREAFLLLEVTAESGSGDRPDASPAELDHT